MIPSVRGTRLFYGWWITAAALGITFALSGVGFYSFSVLLKPLMNEFGWSRGAASVAQSIYLLMAAATGLLVGKLVQQYGVKKVVLLGAVIGGVCCLLLSLTRSIWYFYTLYFFFGIGLGGGAGLVPVAAVMMNWFNRRRGTAIGIATVGIALGCMVLVPLIGFVAENFGWRLAYVFMGLVVLAIDIPLALVLRTKPEEMGLLPDGDQPSEIREHVVAKSSGARTVESSSTLERRGLAEQFRSLPLWLLCLGFVLAQIGEMSIVLHEVAFITDMGISVTIAATALGFTGGIGGVGKVVFGWLTDRISTRYVTMLCFGLQLLGLLILMQTHSIVMVWLFVVIFGFAMGGMPTLLPLAVRDLLGMANFGVMYGFVHFVVVGLATAGPPFAGFMYDATGSYSIAFVTFAVTYAISIVAIYFAWGLEPTLTMTPRGR
ncbi:MAG: MFS transporter [Chloroflexota bacterium]